MSNCLFLSILAYKIMTCPVFIISISWHCFSNSMSILPHCWHPAKRHTGFPDTCVCRPGTISSDNCDKTLDGHDKISNVMLFERREDINSPGDTLHYKKLPVEILSKREWEILQISYSNNKSPWFPLSACNNDFNGPY